MPRARQLDRDLPTRTVKEPKRIVSLVPSDTYTLVRLGAADRLVGRTRYCVEPLAEIAHVPELGGTKDPDVDKILDLSPDLVVMNEEENTRRAFDRLNEARVPILSSIPSTMVEGLAHVARLARALGGLNAAGKDLVRRAYRAIEEMEAAKRTPALLKVFVPIWMDPLMTANGETFLSDALRCAGGENAFLERERRFPLAADLGKAPELAPEKTADKDTRYPRVTLEEVAASGAQAVLLPDEPHPFTDADAAVFRSLGMPSLPAENVVMCTGKWLMWPGLMSLEGHEHIRAVIERAARVA